MPKGVANKRYTAEFKMQVVETMQKEKLSCCETARQFEISDHKRVAAWERIYMNDAAAAASAGSSCPKRQKRICWQKSSGCVRRMNT